MTKDEVKLMHDDTYIRSMIIVIDGSYQIHSVLNDGGYIHMIMAYKFTFTL